MKIQFSKFKKVLAIALLLALLVSLAALPTVGTNYCQYADDYDQCIAAGRPPGTDTSQLPSWPSVS